MLGPDLAPSSERTVLQIEDLDLLLKGFLMDTSPPKQPSSSEVRSGVQNYKIPPPLNNRLAILGLYCNYLTVWGSAIINLTY